MAAADDSQKPTDPNKLVWVASSNLKGATRDPETSIVDVLFKNGKTYRYANVTAEEMAAWAAAKSAGSWFHDNIRGKPEAHPVVAAEASKAAAPIAPASAATTQKLDKVPTTEELIPEAAGKLAAEYAQLDEAHEKVQETTIEFAGAASKLSAELIDERERVAREAAKIDANPKDALVKPAPLPPTELIGVPTKTRTVYANEKQGTPPTVHPYASGAPVASSSSTKRAKQWWKERPWKTPNGTAPSTPEPPQLGANATNAPKK